MAGKKGGTHIGEREMFHKMKPLARPRFKGGKLVVAIDEENYIKGVEELKHGVVGRIFLKKWSECPTTM